MINPSPERLDFRNAMLTALRQFAPWLATILIVVFAGYPGVICVTPLAWLLATRVGLVAARRSGSPTTEQRTLEGAIAGMLFGLLQGGLFIFLAPRLGEVTASEQASAAWINLGVLVGGMVAGMVLAGTTAWLAEIRRKRSG